MQMTPKLLEQFLAAYPCRELMNADGAPSGVFQLPPARLVFVYLDKPRESDNGTQKYSTAFLFPLAADLGPLQPAVAKIAQNEFGPDWKNQNVKIGVKPQARYAGRYEAFVDGGVYLEATTTFDPTLFDRNGLPISGTHASVYPGAWAIGRVEPYRYRTPMNKGVSFGLREVQIIADDTRFAAASKTEAFAPVTIGGDGEASQANGAAKPANAAAALW